ncbi:unnamed protein product [Effrenium voratum]|uniref:Ion transport domain-containing protein n=1 Tax=Effrenium voratum TaxID=2562239 RepID=A0AA36MX76_9DINO|nr:unnamed protein product [Effrenium voratum]
MLAQPLPEKRSPGTVGPTLQLYPLWVAKQTAKQAGFAAASKLRLNISSVLKTGDSLLDNDACFQRYIMNPYGSKRLAWGILGVILILWDLVVIPLTVFKLGQVSNFLDIMSIITFAYWLLDLPGTFLVGVDLDGTLDMRPRSVAMQYFKTWFFPDLVILLLDVVLFIVTAMASDNTPQALQTASLVRALRLFRIVRLVRLHKAAAVVDVIQMRVRSEYVVLVVKMVRQSLLIIGVNHYIACAWFSVSDTLEGPDTWVNVFGVKNVDAWHQYMVSFHWSLTQFAPATNNVAPQNAIERFFASLIVIYAFVAFSSFVSAMTNAANELRAFTLKSAQQEAQIRNFLGDKKVSSDLWCRIRKFCKSNNSMTRLVTEKDIALFNDIPESLRILLHEELYREVFLDSHFLSGIQDADDLHQICKRFCHFCFSEQVTAAKLDVFVDGTEAQHVYVSRTGDSIYWSILLDRNRQELRGTHWLCELALWAKWHHRGQLVANTTTRFVTIDPKSFATIAASEGGPIFAYLRTLGLLLIGQAEVTEEQSEDGVTDLTLGDELVRNLASRASGFAQFTEPSQRGKSIRLSHLGSLAGLRRSSSDYSSQSWI